MRLKTSYQASRAVDYLNGFKGYLQADGYQGYEQVDAELIGCMAHARRKFVEAQTAEPKNKRGRATFAINIIAKLYRIEKNMKDLTANGLTPFSYLMFLLEELPKKPEYLEYLMPWNVELEATI